MSDGLHPFWKADGTPDRKSTAIIAIVFFLALGGALLVRSPSWVSAFLAGLMVFQAIRIWRRFRSRQSVEH